VGMGLRWQEGENTGAIEMKWEEGRETNIARLYQWQGWPAYLLATCRLCLAPP
jgi:hypothetical protein